VSRKQGSRTPKSRCSKPSNHRGNANRLAHSLTLPNRKLLSVLIDQISQLEHRLGTLRGRPLRPFALESCAGCSHGGIDVGLAGYLDVVCDQRFIVGAVDAERFARLGVDVLNSRYSARHTQHQAELSAHLAIDEELVMHIQGRNLHYSEFERTSK
jgi:hypothetical protein